MISGSDKSSVVSKSINSDGTPADSSSIREDPTEDRYIGFVKIRKLFQNFSFLTLGRVLGDGFTFLLFVSLSRAFGQEGLGQYSFAVAFTGFFVVFSNYGLYSYSIKELSRKDEALGAHYGGILTSRLILSLAVFVILLLVLPFLAFSYEAKVVIALVGLIQITQELVNGFAAVFVASEEMHYSGLLQAAPRLTAAISGLVVVLFGGSLIAVLAAILITTLMMVTIAYLMVARKHGHPKLKIHRDLSKKLLSSATPYAMSDFLARVRSRIDVVLLGLLLGSAAAGVYNAAFRIVLVFLLIPFFAAMALFPLSSRLYLTSREKLDRLYHGTLNLTILFGVPVAFGLWLTAPQIIDLLYGEEFNESTTVLRILTWLIFLATLKSIMGVFLMSTDLQSKRTRSQGISAIVAVIGNLLLIYFLALTGAAIAVLIAEIVLVFLFAWYLRPIFGWPKIGSRLAIGTLAAGSFCLLFILLPSLPIYVVIPISAFIYLGILLSFKDIRENEGKRVLGLVKTEMARLRPGVQEAS